MLKINLKTIASLFVAFVIFAAVSTSAAWMATTATKITKTSSSSDVMWLQQTLNAVQQAGLAEDGKYGKLTTAAIKTFQAAHPAAGYADGIAGKLTIAALNAAGANLGTTPVAQGNCPTGYIAVTPVAPSFAACAAVSGPVSASNGTNGYLADVSSDSSNRVSTVYESEQNKVVAGVRATARLADQTVTRARVTFKNTDTTSSANLAKYISGATLWSGSTAVQTMSVAQADRSTTDDTYTFNFSGFSSVIAKDQIGHFYVSVNANGSLDTTDTTNSNWTVKFVNGGINASSPDGTYDTYPSGDISQTGLRFGKFSSNGVKSEINLSASNPSATVLTAQNTAATNGVTLLKFTVKATNSDLNLRKVPVQVTVADTASTATNVSTVINTLKLYRGTDLVDTMDGSAGYQFTAGSASNTTTACTNTTAAANDLCAFFFSNLSSSSTKIASGETAEFTVVADLKQVSGNYSEGTTVTASLVNADVLLSANYSVQDTNGDQLTNNNSSIRVGSAVGQIMTLRVNGVNVAMGAASISTATNTAGQVSSVTYNIPLTVTSFGNTTYMGQSALFGATTTGQNALAFALQASTAATTDVVANPTGITTTSTLSSSDAQIENLGYRLDSGSAKHFTLQVILSVNTGTASAANYRVHAVDVKTFTDNALSAGGSVQTLLPTYNYQTGYQKVM